jgi:hypothetical protein
LFLFIWRSSRQERAPDNLINSCLERFLLIAESQLEGSDRRFPTSDCWNPAVKLQLHAEVVEIQFFPFVGFGMD